VFSTKKGLSPAILGEWGGIFPAFNIRFVEIPYVLTFDKLQNHYNMTEEKRLFRHFVF
jgi:hypothetical protein